jgi:hypothetical protein
VRELFRVADELSPSIVFIGAARLLEPWQRCDSCGCWCARACCRVTEPGAHSPPPHCSLATLALCSHQPHDMHAEHTPHTHTHTHTSNTHARADEIDAIGTKRYDSHSGGEREIQRTMLELLNQMDGFDALSEVKVRCRVCVCVCACACACVGGVHVRVCGYVCGGGGRTVCHAHGWTLFTRCQMTARQLASTCVCAR